MARYQEIADSLRDRIQSGEFPVGSKLPGISALQEEYEVPGLNTIRAAQQLLVEEGMLETHQGVGVFVTSSTSLTQVDVVDTLNRASTALSTAIAALQAPRRTVTFDLDEQDELQFVLTTALGEFASSQRDQAKHDGEDERLRWAEVADEAVARIENAV